MGSKDPKDISFKGVALLLIMLGAALFSFSAVAWFYNYLNDELVIQAATSKAIGGLVILGFGYIIAELELLRKNN